MTNQSSSPSLLCASFNQDHSYFAVGTRDGVRIFDANTGRLCYERAPTFLLSLELVIRLIVILQDKAYIYEINSLTILDTIDTVPNIKGLCAFSPSLDACYLALPASTTKGSALLYNVMECHLHCEIEAHRSPLAAMVLSSNGMYIATASEQGTIIRVHLVSDATKCRTRLMFSPQSYSFRRGTYPSTIFSVSFGPSKRLPDILAASSSSGSIHLFTLGFASRPSSSKRSSGFLGSIIPDAVHDVLDPAHHHVLHNAVPAGVKSYAVIRKVENVTNSSSSELLACRPTTAANVEVLIKETGRAVEAANMNVLFGGNNESKLENI
ncbi:hypothetical protein JHK85_005102 [Glycine max]|nr:hypothetical protein JHK85_005102 [Glycine max]KAG5080868.1 hypothetical protein JHK86_004933 [Glycine max]